MSEKTCEYPGCEETEELSVYGFTIDEMPYNERTYCPEHEVPASCIDP